MRFEKRDWWVALAFGTAALALRIPLRCEYGYYWDGLQFALAIEKFDMPAGLPHPPGFFLYIMFGRLLNLLVGEPHTTLLWINIVGGALLAGATYLLGTALFGRRCGLFTGIIMTTSPLTWFYSEFALTTIPDSLLVVLLALVCWRVIQEGGNWRQVILLSVLMAVIGGVRSQTAPGMLPLWLYTFWRMREARGRKLLVAAILVGVLGLIWIVPMLQMTGGLGPYLELIRTKSRFDTPYKLMGGGWPALAENVAIIVSSLLLALLLAGVLAVAELGRFVWRVPAEQRFSAYRRNAEPLRFLALWVVPQLLFGTVVMYTYAPGYILSYFPAIAVLVAVGVAELTERIRARDWAVAAAIAAVNAWVYLCEPASMRKMPRLLMSEPEIRQQSRQLAAWFQTIRERYRPGEVQIWHSGQWYLWGVRHFQYYLPEYENWLLTPDPALAPPRDKLFWRTKNRQTEFVAAAPRADDRPVILVVPPGGQLQAFAGFCDIGRAVEIPVANGVSLYEVRPRE